MLRTADDIIEALRSRKEALQLSNAIVDDLAGLTLGHFDKVAGPTRERAPSLATLMAIAGALGLAVQFVPDPDSTVAGRWTRRREDQARRQDGRISKAAIRKARPLVLAAAARAAAKARWETATPAARAAVVAKLNAARAAKRKRRTRTNKAA
jgi:hypothetical protein